MKGFEAGKLADQELDQSAIRAGVKRPSAERPQYLYKAFEEGFTAQQISEQSGIDPWFVAQLEGIYLIGKEIAGMTLESVDYESMRQSKEAGFSDRQLADYWNCEPSDVRPNGRNWESIPLTVWWIPVQQNLKHTHLITIPPMGMRMRWDPPTKRKL